MSDQGHDEHHSDFVPRRYLLAEFGSPQALLAGTTKMREAGYKNLDTHSPFPIHGIEEAIGLGRPKIPLIVLCGAILGACIAYSLIYYCNVFDWPLNIGNRPPHGPPANIPITFELAVLLGGGSAFLGFFALAKLPQPYHPVFESEDFLRASIDAFFLSIELDPGTDVDRALADIRAAGAMSGEIVEESER
jgi:Alternative complex III, ActD subunit